ncbi:MAG TPA: hypothetical protein ENN75_02420 [candidate division Zixibacteria bacterium]|nr:hypothetical protein [candidate division Zixibacteria bacterium]
MKLQIVLKVFLLIALLLAGCGAPPSYIVPETLFSELLNSQNPFETRVIENNWRAFSTLGEAYRADGNLLKAKSIFDAFMSQRFGERQKDFKSAHYDIMIEYGSNLLKAAPEGTAVAVYYDELFYSTMFAREVLGVRPNTHIIWAKALPVKAYRNHLRKTMGIDIPAHLPISGDPGVKLHESMVLNNFAWLADTFELPMFISASIPGPLRPSLKTVSLGIGTLTGVEMTSDERFEQEVELLREVYVLTAAGDPSISHPELIRGLVQWYSDPPLIHGRQRLVEGDTAAYSTVIDILLDRLPSSWKAPSAYLHLNSNISEDERREMLNRIERYIMLNPGDKGAVRAYQELADRNGEL